MDLAIIFAAPPGIVDTAGEGVIYPAVGAPWDSGMRAMAVAAALMADVSRPRHMGIAAKPHGRWLSFSEWNFKRDAVAGAGLFKKEVWNGRDPGPWALYQNIARSLILSRAFTCSSLRRAS